MNKNIRLFSLLLACLMLTSVFTACGDTTDPHTGNKETIPTVEDETDPLEQALAEYRAEADWGGNEFGILYVDDIAGYTEEVEAVSKTNDTSSSGVINDAVYERNTLFAEYCNLNFVLIPVKNSAIASRITGEVSTGTGDFHLISQTTDATAKSATAGQLVNYLELDIDYEQEWWDAGTLDFALDGRVFFMDGPFNIVDDDVTFVMMFNKELSDQYKVPNLYQTVRNNEWTLDYFNSVIGELSTDNGDQKWDEQDTYGFSAPSTIGNTFFYGAGLQYVVNSRDMDMPELVLSSKMERAVNVLELARSVVHENNSSYIALAGNEALSRDVFVQGRSLFYCEAANYLRHMNATMEKEYGVVPIPKYDKIQENYTTWRHSIGSTLSIPTSIPENKREDFTNVLMVYTLLSQKLVRPAYYDTMLTTRSVQDVESSDMLDLIFLHRTYDMAMYFTDLGFASLFSEAVVSSGVDFSSKYKSASKSFDRSVSKILRNLQHPR